MKSVFFLCAQLVTSWLICTSPARAETHRPHVLVVLLVAEGSPELENKLRGELASLPYEVRTLPWTGQEPSAVIKETGAASLVVLRQVPASVEIWVKQENGELLRGRVEGASGALAVRTTEYLRAALLPIERKNALETEGPLSEPQDPAQPVAQSESAKHGVEAETPRAASVPFEWGLGLGPTLKVAAGGFRPLVLIEGSWLGLWQRSLSLRVHAATQVTSATVSARGGSARLRVSSFGTQVGPVFARRAFSISPELGVSLLVWTIDGEADVPNAQGNHVTRPAGEGFTSVTSSLALSRTWRAELRGQVGFTFPRPTVTVLGDEVAALGRAVGGVHLGFRWVARR